MKDMCGTDIHVGDEIVYVSDRAGSPCLTHGIVESAGEKRVQVRRLHVSDRLSTGFPSRYLIISRKQADDES